MTNAIKLLHVPVDTGGNPYANSNPNFTTYLEFLTPADFSERYPDAVPVIEKNGVANFYTKEGAGIYEVRCQVVVAYGLFPENNGL